MGLLNEGLAEAR